jgi:hypothetical protein
MLGNGDGNGSDGKPATITYAEARGLVGPPRDRLDRLALFAADQSETLRRAIEAQARAMSDMVELLNERFRNIEGEIMQLRAQQQADTGDEDEGVTLQ